MGKYTLTINFNESKYVELDLPSLQGTDKQVEWADNIRMKFLRTFDGFENNPIFEECKEQCDISNIDDFVKAIQIFLLNKPLAKVWIDDLQNHIFKSMVKMVSEFINQSTIQNEDESPKNIGLQSQLLSVKKTQDEGVCEIVGKKKSGKIITSLRKIFSNRMFPNDMLVSFNNDVYMFEYNGDIGKNIKWVGNYKQNIWSDNISQEQKDAMGIQSQIVKEAKEKGPVKHIQFDKIKACVQLDIPVYLVGPAGSGKNHTLEQIARELDLDFYFTNSIQQEHKLTGFIDAGGKYHKTEFYKAFTNGGLFFLDEMDASIPEVLVLLNAAIANGYFEFPNGRADAHADFRVVAAGNTMGSGADEQYTGRLVLDQATLDRFCIIEFDYDIRIEMRLAKGDIDLVNFIRDLREQSFKLGIRATYSYRCIIAATKLNGILLLDDIILIAIVKGIDKDTLRTYQTNENRYSKVLAKLQMKK